MSEQLHFTRLGHFGEIHLTANMEKTLCDLNCNTPAWSEVPPVGDRNAQLCKDCKTAKSEMEEE